MISLIQKIPSVSGSLSRRKPRVNSPRQLFTFETIVHRLQVTRLNVLTIFLSQYFHLSQNFFLMIVLTTCIPMKPFKISVSCTEVDVEKLLLGLNTNKACEPDGITTRMFRESASIIAPSLSKIFNISLKLGKLPSEWKSANITPVFKKGVKESVTNYRPISLTCLVFKVLEKLIAKHISVFLDQHNLLSVHIWF